MDVKLENLFRWFNYVENKKKEMLWLQQQTVVGCGMQVIEFSTFFCGFTKEENPKIVKRNRDRCCIKIYEAIISGHKARKKSPTLNTMKNGLVLIFRPNFSNDQKTNRHWNLSYPKHVALILRRWNKKIVNKGFVSYI